MVPVITPVASIDSPGGRPVAEKVSVSLLSGSLNDPETSSVTGSASSLVCAVSAVETGASLTPVTVMETVAVSVPPSPSEIV